MRGSMFANMLFVIGVIAGHSTALGGESWLLGFGSHVDAAVAVIHRGVQNPVAVSNSQLEKSIDELGLVTNRLEAKLDQCLSSIKEQKNCNVGTSRRAADSFRRKILNTRALVVFLRNLMIMEFNKPATQRNFALANRLGQRIRRFA
jgi:hypothetical protein